MPHPLPLVALVGQPNVGKSTLLNKISRQPMAVTSPIAGTTRDRQYVDTVWSGVQFTLVDTAGLTMDTSGELELGIYRQVEIALREADIVVLVVDGHESPASIDSQVLKKFRKAGKSLILCINKLDSPKGREEIMAEFMSLGIKSIFPVSAVSGRGVGDLLEGITESLTAMGKKIEPEAAAATIAVSIVGKPNVGKSSIFNSILQEERVVVSPVPGTTRTAIDSLLSYKGQDFTFIDTAGLKRKEHRQEKPDIYSGFQTFKAIHRSDICMLVVDSTEEITKQDQRIAQEIFEGQKGIVVLATKIDAYNGSREKLQEYISDHLPFLWMSPVFFVSGKTGEGLEEALDSLLPIWQRRRKTIEDAPLADFLRKKLKINPPLRMLDQKTPKVYSLRQTGSIPPVFELLVNHPAAISQAFRRYVENSLIKEMDFWGTPINLRLVGKDKA